MVSLASSVWSARADAYTIAIRDRLLHKTNHTTETDAQQRVSRCATFTTHPQRSRRCRVVGMDSVDQRECCSFMTSGCPTKYARSVRSVVRGGSGLPTSATARIRPRTGADSGDPGGEERWPIPDPIFEGEQTLSRYPARVRGRATGLVAPRTWALSPPSTPPETGPVPRESARREH